MKPASAPKRRRGNACEDLRQPTQLAKNVRTLFLSLKVDLDHQAVEPSVLTEAEFQRRAAVEARVRIRHMESQFSRQRRDCRGIGFGSHAGRFSGQKRHEQCQAERQRGPDAQKAAPAASVLTRRAAGIVETLVDYPTAHEDDAERAVRAARAILTAMDGEPVAGERLQVRIGVATGEVVVGDLVGEGKAQEEAVIGEMPNLAARLQQVASPGSVVIAPATRNLLGSLFELEDLGTQVLKGIATPMRCWRVVGEQPVDSRFEAARGGRFSRFVGREQELALLEERWFRAQEGEGQVVLLTGEAGIGKSRLTRALMDRLAGGAHTRLRYQCSPYHVNTSLRPFIAQIERAAGFAPGDGAEAKRAKLEALLR